MPGLALEASKKFRGRARAKRSRREPTRSVLGLINRPVCISKLILAGSGQRLVRPAIPSAPEPHPAPSKRTRLGSGHFFGRPLFEGNRENRLEDLENSSGCLASAENVFGGALIERMYNKRLGNGRVNFTFQPHRPDDIERGARGERIDPAEEWERALTFGAPIESLTRLLAEAPRIRRGVTRSDKYWEVPTGKKNRAGGFS